MTEAKWLASDDTSAMWGRTSPPGMHTRPPRPRLSNKVIVSRRLASLFAVACVRATPQAADDAFFQRVVKVVEKAADTGDWAPVSALDTKASERCGKIVELDTPAHFWALAALRLADDSIDYYAFHVPLFLLKALDGAENIAQLRRAYADALRDVVGNPFRGGRGKRVEKATKRHRYPVLADSHLTSTVVALASQMYESRDFGAMPILADALQDAGCDNEYILNHCRGDGPHARGCWVVDLVLGKE